MPRLYSYKHIVRILEENGFRFVSQKGSHAKYHKNDSHAHLTVIIPANRKEIPQGTFHSIIRQSGLNKREFE